jgi:PKD domain
MRALLLAVAATLLLASPAAAAPTWLQPQSFETGLAAQPAGDVAVTPNGTAVAIWVARVGGADLARARVRPPGQGFGPTTTLTPQDGRNAAHPTVAVDAQGNATLTWDEQQGPVGVVAVRVARLPAGSQTFEPAQTVSNPAVTSSRPAIGVGAGGTAVIAYSETGAVTEKVRAVLRNGAAGDFGAPADISTDYPPGNAEPQVGVDDDGDAVVAWERTVSGFRVIEANARPSGGIFGPVGGVQTLSNSVLNADHPALAIAPDGTTVVLWQQLAPENDVRYNERTPANAWLMEPKIASQPGVSASNPAVGMDGAGNAVAAWNASTATASFVQAGLRPVGGAFGGAFRDLTSTSAFAIDVAVNRPGDAIVTFNGSMAELIGSVLRPRGGNFSGVLPAENQATNSTALFNQAVGIDDEGNATGLWIRNVNPGNTWEVATGALDAAPPTLTASVPPGGTQGQAIGMAAAAIDRLSPVGIHWAFGDGGTAVGGAVSHAFGSAGAFTVSVTATDGVGNATTATRPVLVAAAPPPAKKRITSPVSVTWGVSGKRIFLLKLRILRAPKGTKAELRCSRRKSRKCPFNRVSSKKRRGGAITLFKEIKASKVVGKRKRSFRAGQRLELRITKKAFIGKVVRYDLKKGKIPSGKERCLPPGAKKPRKRC